MSYNIHFVADDDGPCSEPVADVEAAKWQIAEWLPGEDGRHDGADLKNTWAKEQLVVEERDGKTFIIMPGSHTSERKEIGPFFETVEVTIREVVWRLEEVNHEQG